MQLSRGILAAVVFAGVLASSGCELEDYWAPCTAKGEFEKKLDGIWAISAINSAPVPTKGYFVTTDTYLVAGSVQFKTRSVVGKCSDPESFSGVVIVRYAIFNGAGQLQPSKTYTGSFDYNLSREKVLFRNSRDWIEGDRSGRTISVQGLVPSTWTQVSINFTR